MGNPGDGETNRSKVSRRKWWQTGQSSAGKVLGSQAGQPCPKCYLADLDLDTLFRLSCPNCGFVANCGAFT